MAQNKLQKSDINDLWHCLLQNGNLCVPFTEETVPWRLSLPALHALSIPWWSHPDGKDSELSDIKTWYCQMERVKIRCATLTQETSLVSGSYLPQTLLYTEAAQQNANWNILACHIYSSQFHVSLHWQPEVSIHLSWHEFFWHDIVNMEITQHGKWPLLNL